jgi:hypothetical protein
MPEGAFLPPGVAKAGTSLSDASPSTQAHGDSAAAGSGTLASRADHKHGMPAAGGPSQANQAAIEGETNEDTYVPPDLLRHHPGIAKVWVAWEQTDAHSMKSSYNMTSVTDGSRAGDTDHLFDTDFSSNEYCIVTCGENSGVVLADSGGTQVAGGVTTITSDVNDGGTMIDVEGFMACFGDQ